MREECKHFQSRTYASGEVARFCVLDLAPEAPWRCPENCRRYTVRLADAGWNRGTLVSGPTPPEPELIELNDEGAALLDEAEDIINSAGPVILADIEKQRAISRAEATWIDKIKRRFRRP